MFIDPKPWNSVRTLRVYSNQIRRRGGRKSIIKIHQTPFKRASLRRKRIVMTRLEAFEVAVYPLVVASTSVKVTVTTYEGDTYHIHLIRWGVYSSLTRFEIAKLLIDAAAFVVRYPPWLRLLYTASLAAGWCYTDSPDEDRKQRSTDLRCIRKLHRRWARVLYCWPIYLFISRILFSWFLFAFIAYTAGCFADTPRNPCRQTSWTQFLGLQSTSRIKQFVNLSISDGISTFDRTLNTLLEPGVKICTCTSTVTLLLCVRLPLVATM
jgi:hypothetical protein